MHARDTKDDASRKRLIVVLGMHRSGTSAIARGLVTLGVDLGDRLMPAAPNNNEKGFFEDVDANALNTEVLRRMGREWDSLATIPAAAFAARELAPYRARAIALLRERLEGKAMFGLKDPRISLLLPFWKGVFEELQLDVGYVLCLRHPFSVAKSLEERDAFDPTKSHYLWLAHSVCAFLQSAGRPRIVVDFDRLMDAPAEQLARMADRLGLAFDAGSAEARQFSVEFLSENLRHTRFGADVLSSADVPGEVREAYEALRRLAEDRASPEDDAMRTLFERLEGRLAQLGPVFAFAQRSARIHDLELVVAARDGQIHGLNLAVAERDRQIHALSGAAEEREALRARVHELEMALTSRDGQIHGLNVSIVAKDRELQQAVGERDARIKRLESELDRTSRIQAALIHAFTNLRATLKEEALILSRGAQALEAAAERVSGLPATARELEASCNRWSTELMRVAEEPMQGDFDSSDAERLSRWMLHAVNVRSLAWKGLADSGIAVSNALIESVSHLDLSRMRLAESLRATSSAETAYARASADLVQLQNAWAQAQAQVQDRDRILSLAEHRAATWLGGLFAGLPRVRAGLQGPLRLFSNRGHPRK